MLQFHLKRDLTIRSPFSVFLFSTLPSALCSPIIAPTGLNYQPRSASYVLKFLVGKELDLLGSIIFGFFRQHNLVNVLTREVNDLTRQVNESTRQVNVLTREVNVFTRVVDALKKEVDTRTNQVGKPTEQVDATTKQFYQNLFKKSTFCLVEWFCNIKNSNLLIIWFL